MREKMNLIRKNILMPAEISNRLIAYADEMCLSQATVVNMAVKKFLDDEEVKKAVLSLQDKDKMAEILLEFVAKNPEKFGGIKGEN